MDVVEEKSEKNSPALLDIGALLVEARENQNLSSQDIADQMNLTLSVITKIEANEFEQDIPLAFIRGYIRSYAKKVGVDVENLCAEFDKQTGQASEPVQKIKTVSDFKMRRKEMNSNSFVFKLLTYLIVTSLLAFGGWELWKKLNQSKQDAPIVQEISLESSAKGAADAAESSMLNEDDSQSSQSALPDETSSESATNQSIETATKLDAESSDTRDNTDSGSRETQLIQTEESIQMSVDSSNRADLQITEVVEQVASNQAQPTDTTADESEETVKPQLTGPVKSVSFEFSADCWVQVTDANGEVLAVGIKRIGKVMPLEGVVPFTVILGEPSAVSIEFDGEVYDLSRFRAGRTARFVLE